GRETVRVEPLPVLGRAGVVPGRVRHQPTEQQFPFGKRRPEPDRLERFAGCLVVSGFVFGEREKYGVEPRARVGRECGPVAEADGPVGGVLRPFRLTCRWGWRGGSAGPGQRAVSGAMDSTVLYRFTPSAPLVFREVLGPGPTGWDARGAGGYN